MLPILFVPQMLFAGFFVAPELIPIWLRYVESCKVLNMLPHRPVVTVSFPLAPCFVALVAISRWARYLCTLTYAVRIALVEEFGDGCPNEDGQDPCKQLLEAVDADPDETWWCVESYL